MTIVETWTGLQDRVQEKLDRQAGDQEGSSPRDMRYVK
jgi:hypothetical protein